MIEKSLVKTVVKERIVSVCDEYKADGLKTTLLQDRNLRAAVDHIWLGLNKVNDSLTVRGKVWGKKGVIGSIEKLTDTFVGRAYIRLRDGGTVIPKDDL